jgi:hypothetical protein
MRMRRLVWSTWLVLAGCGGIAAEVADGGSTSRDGGETVDATTGTPDASPSADVSQTSDAPPTDVTVPPDSGAPDATALDAPSPEDAPACPPGNLRCGDACVDPGVDPANCGTCGNLCGPPGSCTYCAGGRCIVPCLGGPTTVCNGTCIDPMTSIQYCGAGCSCEGDAAGVQCDSGSVCLQGVCTLASALGD